MLQRAQAYHASWTLPRVQAFPYSLHNRPLHSTLRHSNGTVMCGVISAQQGQQDVHEPPGPVGHHVAMNHAPQRPLEALHHDTFDVIILAGEEVYVSGLEQSMEGRCTHFGAIVALRSQWRSVLHVVQNGLHGAGRLSAALAGQRSVQCVNFLGCQGFSNGPTSRPPAQGRP